MTSIALGTQLTAPSGYRNLITGVTYYFLCSKASTGSVLLLHFVQRPSKKKTYKSQKKPKRNVTPEPTALLAALPREAFESAIGTSIVVNTEQHSLPPWLEPLQGKELPKLSKEDREVKPDHRARIARKLAAIRPLIHRYRTLLDAADPERELNTYIRKHHPNLHQTRVRLWFYCYLLFGRNRDALRYPTHRLGHWDRMETPSVAKRGRPSRYGQNYGYNVNADMKAGMLTGYEDNQELGATMETIHEATVRSPLFGCKSAETRVEHREELRLVQPEGLPFPNVRQMRYHVTKELGHAVVYQNRHGRTRARSKVKPIVGSFSERTWNLMQRVEEDAFVCKARPRGYVDHSTLPALHVATGRDTASGILTGIAFSLGSEVSAMYRALRFCEYVPKPRFCALFGITIEPHQWPSIGKGVQYIHDRGPGSAKKARGRDPLLMPTFREMVMSYSGQSKALIETSNPKTVSNDEPPTYTQSTLRPVEMARKCIYDILTLNASINVINRVPPDLAMKVRNGSPNALWECLAERGRNDAMLHSWDDAVRSFLCKCSASLRRDGVWLAGRRYKSPLLEKYGATTELEGDQRIEVSVYVLEACMRHVWLDWRGSLIELAVCYPTPVGDLVLHMSLDEATQYETYCKEWEQSHKEHAKAVQNQMRSAYEANTNLPWKTETQRKGRPKDRTATAKAEAAEARDRVKGDCIA